MAAEVGPSDAARGANGLAQDVDALLSRCAELFELTSRGSDALYNVVAGLRHVLLATEHPDLARASRQAAGRAMEAIRSAAPVVADDASRSLASDRVYFGLAAASSVVNLFGRPAEELRRDYSLSLALDRIDHTAILADELDALCRRRAIAARGDALSRNFAIRRAVDASADGATLH